MNADTMHKDDFDGLIEGLHDVAAWYRGTRKGFVAHVPAEIDVQAIRKTQKQTQEAFAKTYGFSLASIRDWEQGRRQPERAARILLAMIAKAPQTVKRVMEEI